MNEFQKRTLRRLGVTCTLLLAAIVHALYTEYKAVEQGGDSAISVLAWQAWAHQPGAVAAILVLVAVAIGILFGHFFWQSEGTYESIRRRRRYEVAPIVVILVAMLSLGCGGKIPVADVVAVIDAVGNTSEPPAKPADPPIAPVEPQKPVDLPTKPAEPQKPAELEAYQIPEGAPLKYRAHAQGQGFDVGPMVFGVPAYCRERGWTDGRLNCEFAPPGDPRRLVTEKAVGGGCPVWEGKCYSETPQPGECPITFDHFDHDDPIGVIHNPNGCQVGPDGHPTGGFWVVGHGRGFVRACSPNGKIACSDWVEVNH